MFPTPLNGLHSIIIIIHLNEQIVPSLSRGSSFKLAWVSVGMAHSLLSNFLLSGVIASDSSCIFPAQDLE